MNIVEMLKNQGFNVIETEHGIFTNNETTGETAEEVYKRYLANKDKQIDNCSIKSHDERIKQLEHDKDELAKNVFMLAEIIETLLGGASNE